MRIAVVSDIHGNLPALEAVVADFRRRGVDAVLNLGDSLSGPLLPRETADYLMAQDWLHLAGNHERQILALTPASGASDRYAHEQLDARHLAWLATLAPMARWRDDVLLCHGTPSSDNTCLLQTGDRAASRAEVAQRLGEARAALVLCGHSHVPRSVRCGASLIVNPGSVGHPAFADDYPYPHVIESGSPDARYALLERIDGAWVPSLLSVAYDHRAMAQLARARQRPDWDSALSTGYMS
ncbi:MAG: metallophosphoesterase family protein [Pseudomonadota bacterium]